MRPPIDTCGALQLNAGGSAGRRLVCEKGAAFSSAGWLKSCGDASVDVATSGVSGNQWWSAFYLLAYSIFLFWSLIVHRCVPGVSTMQHERTGNSRNPPPPARGGHHRGALHTNTCFRSCFLESLRKKNPDRTRAQNRPRDAHTPPGYSYSLVCIEVAALQTYHHPVLVPWKTYRGKWRLTGQLSS